MCGIAGFIDQTRTKEDLVQMTRCLDHRGPDGEGYYFDQGVGMGHKRLAIIDLSSGGGQPMYFENLVVILNGEIYNYVEVRSILEKKGYQFNTKSDTEVVIKAFHCWREGCVSYFIGMYAFVIFDKYAHSMYLFRDRVGVKPLYYYHQGSKFAFSSELKAFKKYFASSKDTYLDIDSISAFFRVGYISNHQSILSNVFKLPPGHYLIYKEGKTLIKEYWNAVFEPDPNFLGRTEDDLLDELESITVSAFKYRMVADVPVGIFLSAGIDSSLVASILTKHYGKIHTFTIGFSESKFDESADARRIASHLGTFHKESILTPEIGLEILNNYYNIFDEPQGDSSSVPTCFVSSIARNSGMKVVLSADGGDELFGGYGRYTAYYKRWQELSKRPYLLNYFGIKSLAVAKKLSSIDARFRLDRFSSILSQREFFSFYQVILRPNSDNEISTLFPAYRKRIDTISAEDHYNQMMEWDFHHYLPDNNLVKVDRATMYNNIEGREPFLDHRLIEFASKLPLHYKVRGGVTKYLLKQLLGRYLPKELYDLPKRGFSAPIQQWLRNNYARDIDSVFHPDVFNNPYLDRKEVLGFISRYKRKQKVNMVTLWFLYNFQKWYNKWIS